MQARAGSPSSSTVQAPHTPCSQPRWVPVSSSVSRRKSARCVRGSACAVTSRPFTRRLTAVMPGPPPPPPWRGAGRRLACAMPTASNPLPGSARAAASSPTSPSQHRRLPAGGADHRAAHAARRVEQDGGHRVGELARLAAGLHSSPSRRRRPAWARGPPRRPPPPPAGCGTGRRRSRAGGSAGRRAARAPAPRRPARSRCTASPPPGRHGKAAADRAAVAHRAGRRSRLPRAPGCPGRSHRPHRACGPPRSRRG